MSGNQDLLALDVVFDVRNVILLSLPNYQGSKSMADITIRISDKALKVALVLLGAVILLWGFSQLWSSGVFRPKYQIQMFIPESAGVQVGASVRLDGLPVGSVTAVRLAGNSADSNRRVELVLRIEKRFKDLIRDDSTAALLSDGLLGGRYVSIQRGFSGQPIQSGGEIRVVPVKEMTVTDFIGALGKMANCHNEEKNSSHPSPTSATESQKSQ